MSQYFIGLSTSGHDPAFAIADQNGRIIFAEASERFVQVKRAWGIDPDHFNHIAPQLSKIIADDPKATFHIATSWTRAKQDLCGDGGNSRDGNGTVASPSAILIPEKIGQWIMGLQAQIHANSGHNISSMFKTHVTGDVQHFDHHSCHATNGVYSAPFSNGLVLVADGEGEVGSISVYRLTDGALKRLWRSWGPGSLGTFYCWLTTLCGFDWVAGEEWKVMGLAAYGTANEALADELQQLLEIENGRPIFAEQDVVTRIVNTMRQYQRHSDMPVESAADLAATGQLVYQRYMNQIIDKLTEYGEENLVIAGGCALNSSYNGYLLARGTFKQVHVPSAPADDGNAIGAALLAWQKVTQQTALSQQQGACYLGSSADAKLIEQSMTYSSWPHQHFATNSAEQLAQALAAGDIVGVFRGAAEFGPRALGHRSILADPRNPDMKTIINAKVKGREAYRPFAPMILEEHLSDWFELTQNSPFMAFAYPFKADKTALVPAVVHADNTGRVQTVNQENEPWLHALLSAFYALTGVPILLNTSFNIMGKPIVHSVQDAVAVFGTSGLDGLLLEDVYFTKK